MKVQTLTVLFFLPTMISSSQLQSVVDDGKQDNISLYHDFTDATRDKQNVSYIYTKANQQLVEVTVERTKFGLYRFSKPKQVAKLSFDNDKKVAAFVQHLQQSLVNRDVVYWLLPQGYRVEFLKTSYGGILSSIVDGTGRLKKLKS